MRGQRLYLRPGVPVQVTPREAITAFVDRQADSGAQRLRLLKVRVIPGVPLPTEERAEARGEFGRLLLLDRYHVHHRATEYGEDGRIAAVLVDFK